MRKEIPATRPTECRSCQAPILWVQWASGKRMPVDAEAVPYGDIAVKFCRSINVLLAAKVSALDPELAAERKKYVSHFSTCPHASQHRRGR